MALFGKELSQEQKKTEEIINLFSPQEGTIAFYYGKVRNGKTYAATADILGLLERGEVVFANWNIDFNDFDERRNFRVALIKFVFGRSYFFKYKKDNFHYFSPATAPAVLVRRLNKLVNVHIFMDEGQWILNSHNRNPDPEAQALVLTNGHYCRSLNIISQRPSNVFKDYRSQVHFWYKCEKKLTWPWLIFSKTIIEDMKDDLPDEESESNKVQIYFAKKKVFQAYNRWAFRGADAIDNNAEFEVYKTMFEQRLMIVLSFFVPRFIKRAASRFSGRRAEKRAAKIIHTAFEETYPNTKPLRITDVKIIKGGQLDKKLT